MYYVTVIALSHHVSVVMCFVHKIIIIIIIKFDFCWGSAPAPLGELTTLPRLPSCILRGPTSVHQAKLVAALLRVATVTAGLSESNGSLPSGL